MRRLAVDTGGTFTDIVYIDDDTLQLTVDKVPTTPRDLGEGVLEAIRKIKTEMSLIALFIHGTTTGLNTIAQRRGAKVGLITTRGFIDVLEMTRSNRKEVYNYLWKKPKPLVPRYLRQGVRERTNYRGEILEKLDEEDAKAIVGKLRENSVEAIAVCLLHSYVNPENEQRLGEIISEIWPDVNISLSHQVAREIGENRRANTTVISAYMGKAVAGYISRLSRALKDIDFNGQLLILGPSGVLGIDSAMEKPLYSLASGPVGGAAGAAYLARLCGVKDVVTMDVGGTSFDVSIIKDGINMERHEAELMGYPVLMAGIEIRSIGAGGGSIARVDDAGLLTVGPESAGADPGPMSYGLGGTEPTVTDAALVNGLIDPGYFLGGEVSLDVDLAKKGIDDIAKKLGLSRNEAADGILAVARNNMTTATTEILIGQGYDPRDFTIMAFGGGGGIFVGNIARDMSISRVIVPPNPGVFSARGILTMDLVHTYVRAYARSLNKLDIPELDGIFKEIEDSALETLVAEGMKEDQIEYVRSLDMSYQGQQYYIETPVPGGKLTEKARMEIGNAFENLHENKYGHRVTAPLATANIRLKAIGKIKDVLVTEISQGKDIPNGAIKQPRKVYLEGILADVPIYERDELLGGNTVIGPAIIEEPFHTTVVMPGQVLRVDKLGNLIIDTGGS
ncbi:MAG TPA: hydantoinase/oxoprolinase family protein [Dehalococcoidia bacterium]|nr:hydantoinase/oxoprolinase family protein [Dehalococcoidia bacterium]